MILNSLLSTTILWWKLVGISKSKARVWVCLQWWDRKWWRPAFNSLVRTSDAAAVTLISDVEYNQKFKISGFVGPLKSGWAERSRRTPKTSLSDPKEILRFLQKELMQGWFGCDKWIWRWNQLYLHRQTWRSKDNSFHRACIYREFPCYILGGFWAKQVTRGEPCREWIPLMNVANKEKFIEHGLREHLSQLLKRTYMYFYEVQC